VNGCEAFGHTMSEFTRCCLPLLQLSGESLLRQLRNAKASTVGNGKGAGAAGDGGSSSIARRRSRKASSVAGIVGGVVQQPEPGPARAGSSPPGAAVAAEHPECTQQAATADGQRVVAPVAPWFKRWSLRSLTLTVDYNVRCPCRSPIFGLVQ
jgi:hypothetical protein